MMDIDKDLIDRLSRGEIDDCDMHTLPANSRAEILDSLHTHVSDNKKATILFKIRFGIAASIAATLMILCYTKADTNHVHMNDSVNSEASSSDDFAAYINKFLNDISNAITSYMNR